MQPIAESIDLCSVIRFYICLHLYQINQFHTHTLSFCLTGATDNTSSLISFTSY